MMKKILIYAVAALTINVALASVEDKTVDDVLNEFAPTFQYFHEQITLAEDLSEARARSIINQVTHYNVEAVENEVKKVLLAIHNSVLDESSSIVIQTDEKINNCITIRNNRLDKLTRSATNKSGKCNSNAIKRLKIENNNVNKHVGELQKLRKDLDRLKESSAHIISVEKVEEKLNQELNNVFRPIIDNLLMEEYEFVNAINDVVDVIRADLNRCAINVINEVKQVGNEIFPNFKACVMN